MYIYIINVHFMLAKTPYAFREHHKGFQQQTLANISEKKNMLVRFVLYPLVVRIDWLYPCFWLGNSNYWST